MSCTDGGNLYHCRDFVTWQTMSFHMFKLFAKISEFTLTIGTNREFVVSFSMANLVSPTCNSSVQIISFLMKISIKTRAVVSLETKLVGPSVSFWYFQSICVLFTWPIYAQLKTLTKNYYRILFPKITPNLTLTVINTSPELPIKSNSLTPIILHNKSKTLGNDRNKIGISVLIDVVSSISCLPHIVNEIF